MKVKISEYTPYLLVGLLIVVIARHFYNPLQLVDMWEVVQEGEEMSMPIPVMENHKCILPCFDVSDGI